MLPFAILVLGLSVTLFFVGLLFFYIKSYSWAVTMADSITRKIQENTKELADKVGIIEEKNRNLEEARNKMVRLMKDTRTEKQIIEDIRDCLVKK